MPSKKSSLPGATWPAVAYEEVEWHGGDGGLAPRRERLASRSPCRAAIVPAIAKERVILPPDVATAAEDASNEIVRFDAEAGQEIAPFSAILVRSESAASSRIENLTASARSIAEAELGHGTQNATLIVANERAMTAAIALADRLDGPAILNMHHALLHASAPGIAGKWRSEQVWIGGSNFSPHNALFVPPRHERVQRAIDDVVRFIARTDIPTLAHAAITHAQFESIHPFPDGNGRVGRALVHAQLRHAKLTRHVTVPVSAGLLTDIDAYYDALDDYRAGNPVPIVEQMTLASFSAVANGRQLVTDLRRLRDEWEGRIKTRKNATAWKVLDVAVRHPVMNAALLARELGMSSTNVYRVLQPLVDAEVLIEFTDKKRDRLWRVPGVLTALDAFATRAGRRRRSSSM